MTRLRPIPIFLTLLLCATNAFALGEELGQSKEELKLDYTLSVTEHKTGRITVVFRLEDEGRLKPLSSVDLSIPSDDGTGYFHLVTALKLQAEGDAKVARIHIHRDWTKNANITLKTSHLDGKSSLRTWYYHVVPISKFLKSSK
ncbi:MAG: hypothetical protein ACPGVU_03900 [Limisphaerales bacterium]